MHILFLSQVLPYPLDAGPKIRSYYVLKHLCQRHRVTLLAFVRDSDRAEDIAHLQALCHAVHTVPMRRSPLRDARFLLQSLLRGQPFIILRDEVRAMVAAVHRLLHAETFDAVHADQLWMAQYALLAEAASPRPRLILDQHNAVHLIPHRMAAGETNPLRRAILAREARTLRRYEAAVCRRFDRVVWVTEEDRRAVAALPGAPPLPGPVIPICTDPDAVPPVERRPRARRITFLGGLHWPPNAQGIRWFAAEVFPRIRARQPDAVLTVIGKNPPAGLDAPGVEVTGYVPDPSPYLSETAAFIVPLHAGGGMRVKILDAWIWGLPIVSTPIGAEGIAIRPGEDILIAGDAPAFAGAVLRLLEDESLARRLAAGGRQTVLQKYNWRTVYSAWDGVYSQESPIS